MAEPKSRSETINEAAVGKTDVTIFSVESADSNVRPIEDDRKLFGKFASLILPPPLPPRALVRRYDESYALRPNIDAYVTNIEGYGHRFEPRIDLKSQDSDEKITDAILMRQIHTPTDSTKIGVDAKQLAAKRKTIEVSARMERLRLEMFFQNPVVDESFTRFRMRMRRDLEVTGNAYIEVLRNHSTTMVVGMALAPSVNMRLTRQGKSVLMKQKRRVSPIDFVKVRMRRRFRRYIQTIDGSSECVFFKQVGDPRVMSSKTGKYFRTVKAFKKSEGERAIQATEVIHLRLDDPQSAYGTPRWQGGIMAVIGGRAAEEVNAAYFDEKCIPPGFLMVSGAPLKAGSDAKIEQYLKDHIKGRRNFWSIVVIEAESAPAGPGMAPPRARLEWVPMTEQQQQDALFQNYDERNGEKIGNMFRLPKILRGDMKDFNRSTGKEALRYAEQQVFEPERKLFDEMINDILFLHMDVKYWKFVSNSPITRDPTELSEVLNKEIVRNNITGAEARQIIGRDLLNRELEVVEEDWAKVPYKVYELQSKQAKPERPEGGATADTMLSQLQAMRGELTGEDKPEGNIDKRVFHALDQLPRQTEILAIPDEEFAKLFEDNV